MNTPLDDLTPKERQFKAYLDHLVAVHDTTDTAGQAGCDTCDKFKAIFA